MNSTTIRADIVQRAGELACLMALACELSRRADGEGDQGAGWKLRALLSATKLHADALHDAIGHAGGAE
jgi:alkylhydroperoxidase family enzyme